MRVTKQPLLKFEADLHEPTSSCVTVFELDPDQVASLRIHMQANRLLKSIFRVSVAEAGPRIGDRQPVVAGRYQITEDGIRFIPYFPFERGISYLASFDPRPLGYPHLSDMVTIEFSLPKEQTTLPAEVTHIFPSSDCLPENLLRFYVRFSNPMQRGRAADDILLLGPDGEPATDVLYRAPVELWDRNMRCLTILLDPGRLKRGIGPNRDLGPPLSIGEVYTLAVGAGMTDSTDGRLPKAVYKRFLVINAVREPIEIEQWEIVPPETKSRQPIALMFPRPLDWALLSKTVTITSARGQPVNGKIVVDQCERRWSFTPASPWDTGDYHVCVATSLEDVCGNNLNAPFDRSFRLCSEMKPEVASRSIPFRLA